MNRAGWIMDMGWIAAFACGAVFALGGCSGNDAAPPPGGGQAPADLNLSESDPSEPDPAGPAPGGTPEAQEFEEAFEAAEAGLEAAQAQVRRAVREAGEADTDAARAAAQAALGKARTDLAEAAAAARGLEAQAPSDDDARLGRARLLAAAAEAALAADTESLRAAEAGFAWSARPVVQTVVPARRRPADVERTTRKPLYTDRRNPVYQEGKILLSAGRPGSGDWQHAWGFPITGATNTGWIKYHEDHDYVLFSTGQWGSAGGGNRLVTFLRIDRDGLAMTLGGSGGIRGDGSEFGGTPNAHGLTMDFGRPMPSPEGYPEYYWESSLLPGSHPTGTYYVRLSTIYDVDRNAEYADGRPYPDDDEPMHLSYSAYGHMEYIPNDGGIQIHRVYPFLAGYEAFWNAAGQRVADIADEDKLVSATFKGRTIAAQFNAPVNAYGSYWKTFNLRNQHYMRLRGDVELTVTMNGTTNTVSGKITDMEQWDEENGYWEPWARFLASGGGSRLEALNLHSTNIAADGYFRHTMDVVHQMQGGGYHGKFFGPRDDLEVVGTWLASGWPGNNAVMAAGSFGAKQVPDD